MKTVSGALTWSCIFATITLGLAQPSAREEKRPTRFNLSINGSKGLIRAASPYSLESGEVGIGFSAMNYDRDPGDVDFVEVNLQAAIGLPGNIEVFARFTPVLRTNSVNQDPLRFPFPPLDLFVDTHPDNAERRGPFFLYPQEAPYKVYFLPGVGIKPPTRGAFGTSTGDTIVGAKVNFLSEDRDQFLGFGLQGFYEFPTEEPDYATPDWREKAGVSGERDYGFDLLFSKRFGSTEVLLNGGYKKIGDPPRALRIQRVDSGARDASNFLVGSPLEVPLDLKDEVRLAAGVSFPAFKVSEKQVWFVGEVFHKRFVGSGTATERLIDPVEIMLGLQLPVPRLPWLSIGSAWLMYLNPAGNGGTRSSPLRSGDGRGDINFSPLVDPELAAQVESYLASRGATFSNNASRVFATNNAEFDSWRNILVEPGPIVSRGGGAAILFVSFRPGKIF